MRKSNINIMKYLYKYYSMLLVWHACVQIREGKNTVNAILIVRYTLAYRYAYVGTIHIISETYIS